MWTYRYSCLGSPWQVTIINISRWTFVLRPAMNAVCLSTYKQHPSFEELPLTMLPVLSDQDMTGLVTRNFHPNHSVISSSYSWRSYGLSVHALIYRRAIRLLVDYASVIVCHYSKHQCSSVYLTLPVSGTFCYGVASLAFNSSLYEAVYCADPKISNFSSQGICNSKCIWEVLLYGLAFLLIPSHSRVSIPTLSVSFI
jgi:hypothetical protein